MNPLFSKIKKPLIILFVGILLFSQVDRAVAAEDPITPFPDVATVQDTCLSYANFLGTLGTIGDIAGWLTNTTADMGMGTCILLYTVIFWLHTLVASIYGAVAGFFDWAITPSPNARIVDIPGVKIGWQIFKAFANLFIIFGLLFSVIPVVFKVGDSGVTKKIFRLLLVAVLVNFSFLITAFVVDASQIVSLAFWQRFTQSGGLASDATGYISNGYMAMTNMNQLLSTANLSTEQLSSSAILSLMAFAVIIEIVFIIIFLSIGFLLLIRFAVLWLLAMLSPVAFLGFGFSSMAKWWQAWWNTMIRWNVFAPATLLFLLVGIVMFQSILGCAEGTLKFCNVSQSKQLGLEGIVKINQKHNPQNSVQQPSVILQMLLVVVFMVAAVIAANSTGIKMANYVAGGMAAAGMFVVGAAATSVLARTALRERLGAFGAQMTKAGAERGGIMGAIQSRIGLYAGRMSQFETETERKKYERMRKDVDRDPNALSAYTSTERKMFINRAAERKDKDAIKSVMKSEVGERELKLQIERMSKPQLETVIELLPHFVMRNQSMHEALETAQKALAKGNISWDAVLKDPNITARDKEILLRQLATNKEFFNTNTGRAQGRDAITLLETLNEYVDETERTNPKKAQEYFNRFNRSAVAAPALRSRFAAGRRHRQQFGGSAGGGNP